MNKIAKLSIIFIFPILMAGMALAQQKGPKPVELEKVGESIYLIKGGKGANGGLVVGDNAVLVIDAKYDSASVSQTFEEIKKITDKPIRYLVNTHSDGDHIAGNLHFPKNTSIIAHENCREEFFHPSRDGKPSTWDDVSLLPFVPAITFRDKMDIYLGSQKVELWYFGIGHTKGDAIVYVPDEKTAFIGDLVFTNRPQLIHSYKGGNSFIYVEIMAKILETLDVEKICSGHSDVLDRQVLENHVGNVKTFQEKVKSLMDENKNLDEIKSNFQENEGRLAESIYHELKNP